MIDLLTLVAVCSTTYRKDCQIYGFSTQAAISSSTILAKKCMHATGSMRRKAQCSGALLHVLLNTVFVLLAVYKEKTPLTVLTVHQTAVHIILQIYSFIIIHCKNNLAFINEEWLSSSVA